MPFRDRQDAGRQLAAHLEAYRGEDVLVLGLARGGVPVAREVAHALGAPLDVFVARKMGAPGNAEFGIGAVAPGGVRVVDERVVRALGLTHAELDQIALDETMEMERRLLAYRGSRVPPDVGGRIVILVDDGIATGGTTLASAASLKGLGARRVVVAVPVCAPDSARRLHQEADDVVCVEAPEDFRAVGLWYDDFHQVSDEEVRDALEASRREARAGPRPVRIPLGDGRALHGDLALPRNAKGVVLFAHGSGSSRHSPRNRRVAKHLQDAGLATLLVDLLTADEETIDARTRHLRFDIPLLSDRLLAAMAWMDTQGTVGGLRLGLFGASTGAAAALVAAAEAPGKVAAVVSRGGRPDLAGGALPHVHAPVLLLVGERDPEVLELNRHALADLPAPTPKEIRIIPRATHLFEEPGALDAVARIAADWFVDHLAAPGAPPARGASSRGR